MLKANSIADREDNLGKVFSIGNNEVVNLTPCRKVVKATYLQCFYHFFVWGIFNVRQFYHEFVIVKGASYVRYQ